MEHCRKPDPRKSCDFYLAYIDP